jgi:anaerobic selenocysteine-containing dehydrogenase
MSREDAASLGLRNGAPLLVRSDVGELRGTCLVGPVKRRNVQVHWPEANVLLRRGVTDPVCGIPDYNALVSVMPLAGGSDSDGAAGVPR